MSDEITVTGRCGGCDAPITLVYRDGKPTLDLAHKPNCPYFSYLREMADER